MTPQSLAYPPTDGTMVLTDTINFHWRNNTMVPMYFFMDDQADDMTTVTYGQFAEACYRVSLSLGARFEFSKRPVVALIALADTLVYQAIVAGMMEMGLVPFPISPRNSASAIVHLLKTTSCHYVFATCTALKDLIEDVKEEMKRVDSAHTLTIKEAPTLFEIFPELSNKIGPRAPDLPRPRANAIPKSNLDDVAVYLHSSGSTGFPKPIPKTHRDILEYVLSPCCTIFQNHSERTRVSGLNLPPFHALGMVLGIFLPLFSCVSVVVFPPVVKSAELGPIIPTPGNTLEHVKRTSCNAVVTIPAFLQAWANESESVRILQRLELVVYSGGGISQKTGDFLVEEGVTLRNVYGSTEVGGPAFSSQRAGDEREWEYVEFSENCSVRWIPQGDDTYECHLLTTPTHHLSVCNMPDGYATSDLFRRHPTKEYLWKVVGRLDDVIVHSSGEKTVPTPLEEIIMGSPHIAGVAMFGNGRDQAGLLVEPISVHRIDITDMKQVDHFRSLIWPVVDQANRISPAFSKIFKEMILLTSNQKPLPRAPKGTVLRKLSLSMYAEEIAEMYKHIESAGGVELVEPPLVWDRDCLNRWLIDQVSELCPGKTVSTSNSLFEQGLDSISATILRRRIAGALQSIDNGATLSIPRNVIYSHPTIILLTDGILALLKTPHVTNATDDTSVAVHVQGIEEMILKYCFNDPAPDLRTYRKLATPANVVLLTGSTGQLGSEVLERLLQDTRISKVYTLNRPSNPLSQTIIERHVERFRDKDFDVNLLKDNKLIHLEGDTSADMLGLSEDVYAELCDCISIVIHAAWRLDFNLHLASFETQVRGTHNLVQLARSTPHPSSIKFIFTSSVSVAQSWDKSIGSYPEEPVMDAKYAVGVGYGESKYVAERIIASSGIDATSLRIGQITGSTNGAWATSDWVPILIKSSLELGSFPSAHGNVSWIPMGAVADCISDLIWFNELYPKALNVVHPRVVEWNKVMANVVEASNRGTHLPFVPYSKWFEMLDMRCKSLNDNNIDTLPAIKLLDFFRHLYEGDLVLPQGEVFGSANFSTAKIKEISQTIKDLRPLEESDANRWIEYWSSRRFL